MILVEWAGHAEEPALGQETRRDPLRSPWVTEARVSAAGMVKSQEILSEEQARLWAGTRSLQRPSPVFLDPRSAVSAQRP